MESKTVEFSKEIALQLCAKIRQQYRGKWWTFAGMQCMGCKAATKGDDSMRCVSNAPDYRGCNLVNARFDNKMKKVS